MMTKKKKTENKIFCLLCKGSIDIEIDTYCHLIDYKEGKFYTDGYYHTKCYNEKILVPLDAIKKKALLVLKDLVNKQQKQESEEYIIMN